MTALATPITLQNRTVVLNDTLTTVTNHDEATDTLTLANGITCPTNDATVLPTLGDVVTLTDDTGTTLTGYWLGLPDGHWKGTHKTMPVHILSGQSLCAPVITLASANACTICHGAAGPDLMPILRALADLIADNDATVQAHNTWRDSLIEDLHDEADRRDFCSDFEDFCDRHDLPGRIRTYNLRVTATLSWYISREARDCDTAIDNIDRREVLDLLLDCDDFNTALDDYTVEESD